MNKILCSPLLAEIRIGGSNVSGSNDIVHAFLVLLVVGIAVLILYYAAKYFIALFEGPAIAIKILNAFLVLIGVIVAVNFLMSLIGHGFITY